MGIKVEIFVKNRIIAEGLSGSRKCCGGEGKPRQFIGVVNATFLIETFAVCDINENKIFGACLFWLPSTISFP